MHLLFVHPNFPAQFGHIASYLVREHGYRCTFVSEKPSGMVNGIERIQYQTKGGATAKNHYCSRTFENAIWHAHGVFEALEARPDIQPDLVLGHSGFGTTLFLRDLYGCPIINYFEYFYRIENSDMDFRTEFPSRPIDRLRARARNAMILLDLDNCDLGYSPTYWQRGRFPEAGQQKIRVIFDGIDTTIWKPQFGLERRIGNHTLPMDMKIVSYATRGMESMRGFDIFMKVAKRICDQRDDVLFVVAGEDRVCYGGDMRFTGGKSFKEWVLSQDDYDLSRFLFLGLIPPLDLARLFNLTNLHLYLTVPFVLSWSLLNALACGALVLASNTAPVREVILPDRTGLLADFYDIDGWVGKINQVLDQPDAYTSLRDAAVSMIQERYRLDVCLPRMLSLYQEVLDQAKV